MQSLDRLIMDELDTMETFDEGCKDKQLDEYLEEFGGRFEDELENDLLRSRDISAQTALEDIMADALNAEDTNEYFSEVLRGVRRLACQAPTSSVIKPLWRFIPLLQQYARQNFDEMEALENLVQLSKEELDAATPLLGGFAVRTIVRPIQQRSVRPLTSQTRHQLVRSGTQATRNLARRCGPQAVRALPKIAQGIRIQAVRNRLPIQTLPSAVQNLTSVVTRQPGLARQLSQSAQLIEPTIPAYTQCDFIDPRIDVDAQYALYEMLKGDSPTRKAAVGMLAAVKSGSLGGIYKEEQRVPAQYAQSMGLGWWQLIDLGGKGQPAACVSKEGIVKTKQPLTSPKLNSEPPIIIFRRNLKDRRRLGQALRQAWEACEIPDLPPIQPVENPVLRSRQ
jgi:hypothetical protein